MVKYNCCDCKHACYYAAYWWYPFLDPQCEVHYKKIKPEDNICEDFVLIGRLSR